MKRRAGVAGAEQAEQPEPKMRPTAESDDEIHADDGFESRDYQNEMADAAFERNSIVYLPTGAGKTYISIMLIRRFHKHLEKPLSEGGKLVVYTAPKVALVTQQAETLRSHLPFSVAAYNGSMELDSWDSLRWSAEFSKHQVLVMGAQILKDILDRGFLSLKSVALLVVDECHHATGKHAVNMTMQLHYKQDDPEMPRVLGLTATLIKRNTDTKGLVKEVATLEDNLKCQLIQLSSLDLIKGLYADPRIEVIECAPCEVHPALKAVGMLLDQLKDDIALEKQQASSVEKAIVDALAGLGVGDPLLRTDASHRKMINWLDEIMAEALRVGLFGGALAVECHRNRMHGLAHLSEDDNRRNLYTAIVSQLEIIRHLIESTMKQESEDVVKQILRFSSPKTIACFEQLRNRPRDKRCIIFVERRTTAKVLYTMLQILSLRDPAFGELRPDYAVGQADGDYLKQQTQLAEKITKRAVARFTVGETNVLVASSVVEEGIDVPACDLVIKFDPVKSFCSMVQSKGRARAKNGRYVVLEVDESLGTGFKQNQPKFQQLEHALQQMHLVSSPSEKLPLQLNSYLTPEGATATSENAVTILYKYCSTLGGRFGPARPLWFCDQTAGIKFSVLLPKESRLTEAIQGPACSSMWAARAECALEAVRVLHGAGQLDGRLQPVAITLQVANPGVDNSLFPHWRPEPTDAGTPHPGTKSCRRHHRIQWPSAMCGCAPVAGSQVFLHQIRLIPKYSTDADDQRRSTFLKLLSGSSDNFAIITSKPWPRLCRYPLFTNAGEICIEIETNSKSFVLNADQLLKLRRFHSFLFGRLLGLDKNFLAWIFDAGKNDFLIAPIDASGQLRDELLGQDFDAVEQEEAILDYSDLQLKVIRPTYRTKHIGNYIVTNVQKDASPLSDFPNYEFMTYAEYYKQKWGVEISNMEQPLVDVKQIPENTNFLNPRGQIVLVTRKAQHENDEFAETFVPSLCRLAGLTRLVSSELWLKAIFLPSILQRATVLLRALELANQFGSPGLDEFRPSDQPPAVSIPNRNRKPQGFGPPKLACRPPDISQVAEDLTLPDPDHRLHEGVSWGQLEEFATLAFNSNGSSLQQHAAFCKRDVTIEVVPIKMISAKQEVAPQLYSIYAAMSTCSANDSVDMERLETLGDSYLKFATSLHLFCSCDASEGALTAAKSKLVGNRNLFYCAEAKGIPGIINHRPFAPKSDWQVPNLRVPELLQQLVVASEVNPGVLNEVQLTPAEKKSGKIQDLVGLQQLFMDYEDDPSAESTMSSFLGIQIIPDKCVSDCVEAVIGAYLDAGGPEAAARVVCWFGVLPDSFSQLLRMPPTPMNTEKESVDSHLCQPERLEELLGYKFRDRRLMLEALSHPSYLANRLTDSFQRLEFLGDAILDLLITAHICERFGRLTPGEVTDLRSALVNNVTLASWSVRYGFHTFLLHNSPSIVASIDNFVHFQQQNNHDINDEYLLLLQGEVVDSRPVHVAHAVDVPKLLGDIFESLAGAVFVDSGFDLQATWNAFYPLMKKEIDLFGASVPKNPVRMLYEAVEPSDLEFGKPTTLDSVAGVLVKVALRKDGRTFSCVGSGTNKRQAKRAAAKGALRLLLDA